MNFNNVWAALGQPVSVFRYHDEDHHIGGSDASGIVWKVGEGVTRWKPGDEVVIHCNQASYEDVEVHGLDPLAAPSQQIWGYETTWGSFAQFCKVQAQQLLPKPRAPDLGGGRLLRPDLLHRLPDADRPGRAAGRPPRADLGRGRRPRRVRAPALPARRRRRGRRRLLGARRASCARSSGACDVIDRNEFTRHDAPRRRDARGGEGALQGVAALLQATSRSCSAARPTSSSSTSAGRRSPPRCSRCKPFGKVVICGATSGYTARLRRPLPVDAPEADHRLALRQRLRVPRRRTS